MLARDTKIYKDAQLLTKKIYEESAYKQVRKETNER
jgi:hypothetical protein